MQGKTFIVPKDAVKVAAGFNEAPAKCRGKRVFLIGKITMSKIRKMRDLGRFAHFATYQHHLTIST